MNAASFVEKLSFSFSGNLFPQAVVLGDVGNDGDNELAIGNIHGVLEIKKGNILPYWKRATGLGTITCLAIGDILNKGKNYLVCMNAAGLCRVFDCSGPQGDEQKEDKSIKLLFTQRMLANSKVLLLRDIDGDGKQELAVAYVDRVVRLYRYAPVTLSNEEQGIQSTSSQLTLLHKWSLKGQIETIASATSMDNQYYLIASQPDCTYAYLMLEGKNTSISSDISTDLVEDLVGSFGKSSFQDTKYMEASESESSAHSFKNPSESRVMSRNDSTVEYCSLTNCRTTSTMTQFLNGIKITENLCDSYLIFPYNPTDSDDGVKELKALCTLNGDILLCDQFYKPIWSGQVTHQLFALNKLDLMDGGYDCVVLTAWDGVTYFNDGKGDMVRFNYGDNIIAFVCGKYAVTPGQNVRCLVYVTFNGYIDLYYNVKLPTRKLQSLLDKLPNEAVVAIDQILRKKGITKDSKDYDLLKRKLIGWCIYGQE
ncbi:Integrin-alpha FG-GAP repeat-containing protein 2 [Trichoplax sp. H2]|nr:Integrin-alpha FG-GAP repeat-containing protein 2 [Trichoplax sp. H2]|eukprot:RDD44948.1 Integrin-alpha FG-GAP repeat-containing protein 2 [Trichoplax sp. H2]